MEHTEGSTKTDSTFKIIEGIIFSLSQYVTDLSTGIMMLIEGKLSPQLFPPTQLSIVLKVISDVLPNTWFLAIDAHPGNLWLFYQEIKVNTALTKKVLKLFLHIPIFEFASQYEMYKIVNVPLYAEADVSHGLLITNVPEYLAVSLDRQRFTTLREGELTNCIKSTASWIFPLKAKRTCRQELVAWTGPYTHYLGRNKWVYSVQGELELAVTCAFGRKTARTKIVTFGVIDLPVRCTALTHYWIFPSSYQKGSEVESVMPVTFNISLPTFNDFYTPYENELKKELISTP